MDDLLELHFQKPGLLTTIQDFGRKGYRHLGIPVNGVMDKAAASTANWLVGNKAHAPVLEITLIGPVIEVSGYGQMALTGADLSATISGEPLPMYETVDLMDGDIIRFGRPVAGCRAYLAIGGEWDIKNWLGSFSVSAISPNELTPDSLIAKDSMLKIAPGEDLDKQMVPPDERPDLSQLEIIRVLPGPEFSQLSNISVASLFSQHFTISNDSNRMGYRLEEFVFGFQPHREVISSGIIPGTIQLTNSGTPIILLADAQTSGGYFRALNVIMQDLDKLAQMRPGQQVRFVLQNP